MGRKIDPHICADSQKPYKLWGMFMAKMTAVSVKAAMTTPGTHQDGHGLFLKVTKTGSASWILRIQRDGKRRDIGIGSAKLITLAVAREKAADLRRAVKVERRDVLAERRDAASAQVTFREAAIQYHTENKGGWKSKIYARQWMAGLETYAFPRLGKETTGAITAADIIATLNPIWQTIPETARQVRNRICVVLDYSHAKGWRSSEAPSGNGSLKAGRGLARQQKDRENREAMPYVEVPAFIRTLQRKPSYGRLGLEMLILTCVRSQELRFATWDEFDLENRLWTVPAAHMKRNKAHIVPISEMALSVLKRVGAFRMSGTALVFPGINGGAMSDMTLLKCLRDLTPGETGPNGKPFTVHGFRSSMTDWAADRTEFSKEVVDKAKAHKTPDANEAAYRRTTYLGTPDNPGPRVRLMEVWGAYCGGDISSGLSGKI